MFYKSIASVYDHIFPQNKKQLDFIMAIAPIQKDDNILDIGCATGNLTELLYGQSKNIIGLDLDGDLLTLASKKHPEINFKKMNMLQLSDHFKSHSMDKIISFGNTLVHLQSRDQVQAYFESVYRLLKEKGYFIVQIIHYDRIIQDNLDHLATIDNAYVNFVRHYDLKKEHVDFKTELLIKSNGQVIKNTIQLLALRQSEINDLLLNAGFSKIKFYGNLNGNPLSDQSVALLFACQK